MREAIYQPVSNRLDLQRDGFFDFFHVLLVVFVFGGRFSFADRFLLVVGPIIRLRSGSLRRRKQWVGSGWYVAQIPNAIRHRFEAVAKPGAVIHFEVAAQLARQRVRGQVQRQLKGNGRGKANRRYYIYFFCFFSLFFFYQDGGRINTLIRSAKWMGRTHLLPPTLFHLLLFFFLSLLFNTAEQTDAARSFAVYSCALGPVTSPSSRVNRPALQPEPNGARTCM